MRISLLDLDQAPHINQLADGNRHRNADGMLPSLRRERLTLLLIGAFIAVFIVGIVMWLSRAAEPID